MDKLEKGKRQILKLKYIGMDSWSRPVYKDDKERLWKDVNLGNGEPSLHRSSSNDFDGEPDYPIEGEYEFITRYKENPFRFEYQMLDSYRVGCVTYFAGISNRAKTIDIAYVIGEMKKLWDGFPDDAKPEWLTREQILEFEKEMLEERGKHGIRD